MRNAFAAVMLLATLPAGAQIFHHHADPSAAASEQFRRSPCDKKYEPPLLDPRMRKVVWNVTGNETGRNYFSQGMTEYYGFNFEEAARDFKAALEADPSMAMAAWGVALASGMNININMQGKCAAQALEYSAQAVELAKVQPGITKLERELASALHKRYDAPGLENVGYAVAMRHIWMTAQDDANVTALYAESMLDLRPWGLFDVAKRPALDTPETIDALKRALVADPNAVGANHLLIHAVEAGPSPSEARRAADILAQLVPDSGHLVHMPSHINILLGDYPSAVKHNKDAVATDRREYEKACAGSFEEYWSNANCPAVYYGHYLGHNHFFHSVAAAFAGMSGESIKSARATKEHVARFVVNEPGLQRYLTAAVMMLAAHHQWKEVLDEEQPDAGCYAQRPYMEDTGCHILRAMTYWAHGMAKASLGAPAAARDDYTAMQSEMGRIAPPAPTGWGNNTASAVLAIPTEILLGRITWAEGKRDESIQHLSLAVTHEDALAYDEPPQWFAPARESLGGAYLATERYALARDTFLAELAIHPSSGRALYGLMLAYRGLKDSGAAVDAERRFREAWKFADYEMTRDKLW